MGQGCQVLAQLRCSGGTQPGRVGVGHVGRGEEEVDREARERKTKFGRSCSDLWGLGGRRRKLIIWWLTRNAKQARTQEHSTVHASHRRVPPVGAWAQNVRLSTSARCSCGCRNHRSVPCDASEATNRLSVGEMLSTCISPRCNLHVSREITTIVARPYSAYTACAHSGGERRQTWSYRDHLERDPGMLWHRQD